MKRWYFGAHRRNPPPVFLVVSFDIGAIMTSKADSKRADYRRLAWETSAAAILTEDADERLFLQQIASAYERLAGYLERRLGAQKADADRRTG